jgi:hypothetical protein
VFEKTIFFIFFPNRMSCKEVNKASYQTRKSPAFHAGDCKGLQKKGKDGTYISKADSRGIYKWVKTVNNTRKRKGKYYDIHDNGGRPFRVYIDGSTVSIYKCEGDDQTYDELIKTIKVKNVYIGKSTGLPKGADHGPSSTKAWDGNTILLHVSGKRYMYIGHEIYEFNMLDMFDSYYSMIGNNDVPYPVLVGSEYAYFLLDRCYVPRSVFSPTMTKVDWEDAYGRYYGWIDPMTGIRDETKKPEQLKGKKMKGFHMITKQKF